MGRSQETFGKKEKEKKRLKKRQDKQKKKEERKSSSGGGGLDDMIAYVDENGRIVDTPPDLTKKEEIDVESIAISVAKKKKRIQLKKEELSFLIMTKDMALLKI